MEYKLQSERFELKVNARGAEITSLVDLRDGRQLVWQADPDVWPRHAPLLFPYCGRLFGDKLVVDEKTYPAPKHGFARDMEFMCTKQDAQLVFLLRASKETRQWYPFDFELEVRYTLDGAALRQDVQVRCPNEAGDILPFSLGFHPGFALPLQEGSVTADYEFAFEQEESPVVVSTPDGFVNGETHKPFKNRSSIPLTDTMFENDSICLSGLHSGSITLRRKDGGGRYLRVGIAGYPYVLLWGPPKGPLPFVCIEPWHTLPDGPQHYDDFTEKPGLFFLKPGESYETGLVMEFGPA